MRDLPSGMSRPDALTASVKRSASAPTSLTTSSGSITLPIVFDIFRPCSSRTRPLRNTCENGAFPVKRRPIMIMRATQKKRMSKPVMSVSVG